MNGKKLQETNFSNKLPGMTKDVLSIAVLVAGLVAAFSCFKADIKRRRLRLNSVQLTIAVTGLGGTVFLAFRFGGAANAIALLAASAAASAGVLLTARFAKAKTLIVADITATSSAALMAITFLMLLLLTPTAPRLDAIGFAAAMLLFLFLWHEGRRVMQWQRPDGIVAAEFLILCGTAGIFYEIASLHGMPASLASIAPGVIIGLGGACLLALVLPRYFTTREERRIIAHIGEWGESLQPEYTPPTPECPFPQRWKMYDTMTAEVEVLDFLTCIVTTLKPGLIVETGSFAGLSTLALAQGLQKNGFGRIVSCELDREVFVKAKERIAASGLGKWIDLRNESSLEMAAEGIIDLLFSDSDQELREREVRRFLGQMNPNGLILIHDASSHYGIVRKGAIAMEQEGLVSVVLLPTPRGLVIAQKSRNQLHSQ